MATQLLDALADKGSKQELRDIIDAALAKHDLRIVRWIFLAVGLAAGVIIAAIGVMIRFLT